MAYEIHFGITYKGKIILKKLATIIVCLSFTANLLSTDLRRSSQDQWQQRYKWEYYLKWPTNLQPIATAISNDNSQVVIVSEDKIACVGDITTGRGTHTLIHKNRPGRAVIFAPDGSQLAIGVTSDYLPDGYKGSVCIWDLDSSTCIRTLATSGKYVDKIQFSNDGSKIAAISDSSIHIWDAQSFELLQNFEYKHDEYSSEYPQALALSNDFSKIAKVIKESRRLEAPYRVEVSSTKDNTLLFTLSSISYPLRRHVTAAEFSNDDSKISTHSDFDNYVRIWDAHNGSLLKYIKFKGRKFNPDQDLILSPDFSTVLLAAITDRQSSQIYNIETKCLHPLIASCKIRAAFSSDGSLVATVREGLQPDPDKFPCGNLQILCSIWHNYTPRLALASVLHQRLGAESPARDLPRELIANICSFV